MSTAFDKRQSATILAALRYWQREGLMSSGHEQDIATDGNSMNALDAEEIDALCEQINRATPASSELLEWRKELRDEIGSIDLLPASRTILK